MTKRDFFILIIKLFGLYSLITTIFYVLPSNVGFMIGYFSIIGMVVVLGAFVLLFLLFYILIFKADKICDFLKLSKHFDDDRIEINNLSSLSIIKLAVLLIAGLMIVENIPEFINHCLFAFKDALSKDIDNIYTNMTRYGTKNYFDWIVGGLNILVGYLLITNFKKVSNFIDRKTQN